MISFNKESKIYLALAALAVFSFLNIIIVLFIQKNRSIASSRKSEKCINLIGKCERKLTRDRISQSIALDVDYFIKAQGADGTFIEEYNCVDKKGSDAKKQVRQAKFLWGLVTAYSNSRDERLVAPIKRSIELFRGCSRTSPGGRRMWIAFPGERSGRIECTAFFILSIIDLLQHNKHFDEVLIASLRNDLDKYLTFLISLRKDNGRFERYYNLNDGSGFGRNSAYSDGVALLGLAKAVQIDSTGDFISPALESADILFKELFVEPGERGRKTKKINRFFQHGIMAYYELAVSGFQGTKKYRRHIEEMASWMSTEFCPQIVIGQIAFAYEGLLLGSWSAQLRHDRVQRDILQCQADVGLIMFSSRQVGGPMKKDELTALCSTDIRSRGAIVSHSRDPLLKTDLVYYHLMAMTYAQRFLTYR